jgi:dTDP-4-dehydrorhamnose reductase
LKELPELEKILVTGANGLLGSKLVDALSREYDVTPTHNRKALHSNSLRMNIADNEAVVKVLDMVRPDVVIHTAAETSVDKCETNRELAWNVNALGTKNIVKGCVKFDAQMIYVSTDYVFDGEKGNYSEDDATNPINYYGLTKLKGEEFVMQLSKNFIITRTSVVYGWHPTKLNFATWVIDSIRNKTRISVADDHYNSPTLADDLAEIIRKIGDSKLHGVYHVAGGEKMNRYEFALQIAERFQLDKTLIVPVRMEDLKMWIAKRPRDSSLCIDKLRTGLGIKPLDLTQSLDKMKKLEGERSRAT